MQAPVSISQTLDVDRELATEYRLAIKAMVLAGNRCSVAYRGHADQKIMP